MQISRRSVLAQTAGLAAPLAFQVGAQTAATSAQDATRARRMKWWHDARFGMFIHWGLYSVLGRHEWAMENEAIPVKEYEQLAKQFKPKPNAARDWAQAGEAGGPEVHGDDHQAP